MVYAIVCCEVVEVLSVDWVFAAGELCCGGLVVVGRRVVVGAHSC